jgi:predicted transcriptional regulator
MTNMRIAKTVSITLPPELLAKAQEIAQREHRTMSELMREALRRYMTTETRSSFDGWDTLLEGTRAKARELGVITEEDVDRIVHEYRREKRA